MRSRGAWNLPSVWIACVARACPTRRLRGAGEGGLCGVGARGAVPGARGEEQRAAAGDDRAGGGHADRNPDQAAQEDLQA
eukprot:5956675-Prymnesium_polylepis.1